MKVPYRIPTKEQFAFVEIVKDYEEDTDPSLIKGHYDQLTTEMKAEYGEGIGLKALAKVIHEYCTTGGIVNGGEYDFSEKENMLIAEVKKIIRKSN